MPVVKSSTTGVRARRQHEQQKASACTMMREADAGHGFIPSLYTERSGNIYAMMLPF